MDVISSDYPGTTIDYTKGYFNIQGERAELVDVPGIYSLEATLKAEKIAVQMLKDDNVFISVIDATNLERGLNLKLQLIKQGKPLLIVLNLFNGTKRKGISINFKKLKQLLDFVFVNYRESRKSAASADNELIISLYQSCICNIF